MTDLLVCPSCERRFSVRGRGDGGGWRCIHCGAELRFTERVDSPGPADWHLHHLRSLPGLPVPYVNVPSSRSMRGDDAKERKRGTTGHADRADLDLLPKDPNVKGCERKTRH